MATKSRLGMGLGALFPSLPGESAKSEAAAEPAAPAVGVKADNKPSAKTSGSMAGSAAVPSVRKNTGAKSSMATAQASVDAVHDMKKNVSHETKKGSVHRASMPSITLNEAAHPADMFFGATSPVDPSADAKQGSVSRETAAVKKNEDAKNNEPELLPVQGGYLVELRLSDVGPNLHQPRTIFDEDDLRELADSIKEVGVLQPIVVRKRPLAQIEAARKAADSIGGTLTLLYRVVGTGTDLLSAVRAGQALDVMGPIGTPFPVEGEQAILVAGGMGAAPLCMLARALHDAGSAVTVYLGCRDAAHDLCGKTLRTYGTVHTAYESEGRLVTDILPETAAGVVYACGPTAMLAKVQQWAAQNGAEGYVSLEERMACGIGACSGCGFPMRKADGGVLYKKVCVDGPVFPMGEVIFHG